MKNWTNYSNKATFVAFFVQKSIKIIYNLDMGFFAPLHIISGYSFLQSGLTVKKIISSVYSKNYFGFAVTDRNSIYGAHDFFQEANKINKPTILGCEIVYNGNNISLYVQSEDGYKNLLKILFHVQKEDLDEKILKQHSSDLIAIIESKYGQFREEFLASDDKKNFAHYLIKIADIFKSNFYIGLEITSKQDKEYANSIREFANNFSYSCVAFPRIKYVKKEDAIVLDIVDAIANDKIIEEKTRIGYEFFMNEESYKKIYLESEIKETINIVNSAKFDLNIKRGTMIDFGGEKAFDTLHKKCLDSLKLLKIDDEEHLNRLNYEIDIINKMGYCNYFLIVEDYVKYAKTHDIVVGPGRGSAAGSLISYLLNITEVDPLKYNLQFERFLNPARKTMPDIDVDFMDIKRNDVIDYMREKYGQNRVANIVTFQRILARQSLRDIQRVYGYPSNHIDLLCKSLPKDNHDNKEITLREAYKKDERFKKLIDSDKYFLEIVTLASKIEGLPRQAGMHAAGIVLNNEPLENSLPVMLDYSGNYISQYEMEYLEQEGFLKMDFLSLRNLTVLDYAVQMINKNHNLNLKVENLPYEEKEIFEIIENRLTMGIFQLESSGMKRAIKILKPSCFDDVVALLALFRPGPMDSIKLYSSRKEGKQNISYVSESLKEILTPTYGIIVYQEQINKIAQVMAGFSPAEADVFRRAISKKVKEKILEEKESFINGSIKNGYSTAESLKVFNEILKFANYGFNKSHSVVYAIIACRLAYLKAHFPLEFYSTILQIGSSTNDSKFNEYVSEMKKRNFTIYPPNINKSSLLFSVEKEGLLFPLSSIKSVNLSIAQNVIEERKHGSFKDFYDFVLRMYGYGISEKEILSFINSGSLDCLCDSRETLRLSLKGALQFAKLNHDENGQLSIGIMETLKPLLTKGVDDKIENLNLEYDVIGIMLSDNPIRYKKDLLNNDEITSISDLCEGDNATIVGLIKSKKIISTKKSEMMAFLKIFDETSEIEITVFPRIYKDCYTYLETNKFILIKGKVESDEDELSFIADAIEPLEE